VGLLMPAVKEAANSRKHTEEREKVMLMSGADYNDDDKFYQTNH